MATLSEQEEYSFWLEVEMEVDHSIHHGPRMSYEELKAIHESEGQPDPF